MADGFELDVGHEGEGSDCIGKTIRMGGQGAVAGALSKKIPFSIFHF